jgi:hypothetical protein
LDLACWQQLHIKVAISRDVDPFTLFGGSISDHITISAKITMRLTKRRDARPLRVSKWLVSSRPFKDYVFLASAERDIDEDPFVNIENFKVIFQDAARHAARVLREAAASTPASRASAIAAAARAVHRNDWASLRMAWRTVPELKPFFAPRGNLIAIIDTDGFARLSQSVLHKVASGRLGRAVARGAPRPRIEALLAGTKLYLPHRRRDGLGALFYPLGISLRILTR